jgi:hypothetical protein
LSSKGLLLLTRPPARPPAALPQVTTQKVQRGQEALYTYGSGYWEHIDELIKRQQSRDKGWRDERRREAQTRQELARLQELVGPAAPPPAGAPAHAAWLPASAARHAPGLRCALHPAAWGLP